MEEYLKCQDFYFYPNGIYKNNSKLDSATHTYFSDIEEISQAIRIFGSKEQIDRALDDYITRTKLNLDECYEFKIEKKGSYWYDIFKDPIAHNKMVKGKLKDYQELYLKKNNHARKFKALIINLN